jgi:hypothetical protein
MQKTGCDVEADLQAVTAEHLVLDAVGAPAWAARGGLGDPVRDLDALRLAENAARPIGA